MNFNFVDMCRFVIEALWYKSQTS